MVSKPDLIKFGGGPRKTELLISINAALYKNMINETQNQVTFALQNVCLTQDNKVILRDVTVRENARRIGIVGRNGSGKTTLARVLSGLVAVTSGHVEIGGIDPAKNRKAAINTVGILFQNPDHQIIFPTVEEEIAFGLLQQGHSKKDAADLVRKTLVDFDRAHWAKAAVHQLSQGQKQLVCLMSILAMRPKIVILDEPFSGLDLPTKMQLARAFTKIDSAIIHISHDPEHLKSYDRVLWIDEGALRMQGSAEAVLPAFIGEMERIGEADDLAQFTD
ncbi:energy-coupling factor ABC transporter ATP-binding protein [Pacificibacter marinus]|uniref:Biotin transport ATP-binding protein BioM n=1 Tax=Pacificibacter marinus TaxID=658057 RepID=A0A1Y5S8Z0_9RHOB|nr:ABC transporter ATP-binding protein [Pacificibacter marinus]SEK75148.1 biotin transport system ATP-binding protein [Pacificibacter marinus]SLN35181.1 Biotin transport ATP-binding protein BioM [Pacificibacter marinus]